jgi:hypothetical protein
MSKGILLIAFTFMLILASRCFAPNGRYSHLPYNHSPYNRESYSSTITIYFIPPTKKLDWETPGTLARTALRNYMLALFVNPSHPIGHSAVQITCSNDDSIWAAVTGGSWEGDLLAFFEGDGFDLLRQDFNGEMIDTKKTKDDIEANLLEGTVRWVTIKLSSDACQREILYYDHFVDLGIYKRFNASGHPRELEGAGCTSFALSFLGVVGVQLPMARFERTLRVPINLFRSEMKKPISASQLLATRYPGRWANEGEPQVLLKILDPSEVYDWIGRVWYGQEDPGIHLFIERKKLASTIGLLIDARSIATPVEPLFLP